MQITITFDPQSYADGGALSALAALFGPSLVKQTPEGTTNPSSALTSSEGTLAVAVADLSDAPAAVKRVRKPKQEAVVPAGWPTPGTSAPPTDTSEAASTSASPSSASASAQPSTNLTLDDVRAKLQAFTVARGVPEGIALLKKFEAARISELPAEKYADFVKACEVAA